MTSSFLSGLTPPHCYTLCHHQQPPLIYKTSTIFYKLPMQISMWKVLFYFLISCHLLIARDVCDTFFGSWKFICKGNRWSHLHLLNCLHKLKLHFLFSLLNPPPQSVSPSPPAESSFLIVMLMTVMMVDCPLLPGGQFGRTVTLAPCPPTTWPFARSIAAHIPSQVCFMLYSCICAVPP